MNTIKDIARAVGVSTATVSNALNGRSNVSAEVRERVVKAAREMNYVPNINARLMKSRKTNNIGVFLPYLQSTFYLNLIQKIYACCESAGYSMLVHISRDIDSTMLLSNILSCNIDAAIVLSDRFPDSCIPMLRSKEMPVVFLDRRAAEKNISSVVINEEQGTRQAVEYLVNTGHKAIGHLYGIPEVNSAKVKRRAFVRTMEELGMPVYPQLMLPGQYSEYKSYVVMRALLSQRPLQPMPDAFFCADDETALGCIKALQDEGFSVPRDVSVTGFSSTRTVTNDHLLLSRVHYSMNELARTAVELLLNMLREGRPGEVRLVGTEFIVGDTTRMRLLSAP